MFSQHLIRAAVQQVHEQPISTVFRIDAGKNDSYQIAFEDGSRAVIKVGTRAPSLFKAEPATLEIIRQRTSIPVSKVYGVGEEPLGYPYAVYEFVEGDSYSSTMEMPSAAMERLCSEAGEHLAQLHQLDVSQFGIVEPADGDLRVTRVHEYGEMLQQSLTYQLEELGQTRFADLCPDLKAAGEEAVDAIDTTRIEPTSVPHKARQLAASKT